MGTDFVGNFFGGELSKKQVEQTDGRAHVHSHTVKSHCMFLENLGCMFTSRNELSRSCRDQSTQGRVGRMFPVREAPPPTQSLTQPGDPTVTSQCGGDSKWFGTLSSRRTRGKGMSERSEQTTSRALRAGVRRVLSAAPLPTKNPHCVDTKPPLFTTHAHCTWRNRTQPLHFISFFFIRSVCGRAQGHTEQAQYHTESSAYKCHAAVVLASNFLKFCCPCTFFVVLLLGGT